MDPDRYVGCLVGLAIGDALGAPHEGRWLERLLWRLIGRTRSGEHRWTDDTQMAFDLGISILEEGDFDADKVARRFAESYRWNRGYGPGTARVLKRIRRGEPWQRAARTVYPNGSYGNGAAMRAPVLALCYPDDLERLIAVAKSSAVITHAHPLGVDGAVLVAVATRAALIGRPRQEIFAEAQSACGPEEMRRRLDVAAAWLEAGETPEPKHVARELGHGMEALASCVTALYVALRHIDSGFLQMIDFAIGVGGDVDTIAAMAGAVWGAAHGFEALPEIAVEDQMGLMTLAWNLYERRGSRPEIGPA